MYFNERFLLQIRTVAPTTALCTSLEIRSTALVQLLTSMNLHFSFSNITLCNARVDVVPDISQCFCECSSDIFDQDHKR